MSSAIIPIIVILITAFIFYRVFGRVFKQFKNRKRLLNEGDLTVAYVESIAQTGVTINQQPEMRMRLQIENIGGQPREIEIKQVVDLGSIPRAGDQVYVLIDPKDPDNVVLSPYPFTGNTKTKIVDDKGNTTGTVELGSSMMKGYMALTPELRDRAKPGVGTIVSVMPVDGRNSRITLDTDQIGTPSKRVTITQPVDGYPLTIGSRVYYLYDPEHPETMALAPSAMTGGQSLGIGTNRLDALVLGPQLLQIGAKATGTVISAKQLQMANPILADKGYSKWELVLEVKPQDGTPSYQGNLTISLTSPEKAARIAHEGVEVPLRYDPMDLQTISIDSVAMGYPDPYETTLKVFAEQMASHNAS